MRYTVSNSISNINNSIGSTYGEYHEKYNTLENETQNVESAANSINDTINGIILSIFEITTAIALNYGKFLMVFNGHPDDSRPFDIDINYQLKTLKSKLEDIQGCISTSNRSFNEEDLNTLCEKTSQEACTATGEMYCNELGQGLNSSNFDKVLDGDIYATCTNWYEACSNQFADCDNSFICPPSFGDEAGCKTSQGCGYCQSYCNINCLMACQADCQQSCQSSCQDLCQVECLSSCQLGCETICETSCDGNCVSNCQSACEYACQSVGQ